MKFLTKEWSQQMSKKGFLLSSPQVKERVPAEQPSGNPPGSSIF